MGREEENEKRLRDKEKGRNREETGGQSYVRHQEGTGRKLDREKRESGSPRERGRERKQDDRERQKWSREREI